MPDERHYTQLSLSLSISTLLCNSSEAKRFNYTNKNATSEIFNRGILAFHLPLSKLTYNFWINALNGKYENAKSKFAEYPIFLWHKCKNLNHIPANHLHRNFRVKKQIFRATINTNDNVQRRQKEVNVTFNTMLKKNYIMQEEKWKN